MLSYSESYTLIENRLKNLAYKRQPNKLYEPIEYILSLGGKRIRPCMAVMAYSMFSDDIEQIISAAIGIEVFHNFTLLHDDIMDNAEVRRSYPTVHKKWDENTAILSGDAMLILAYQLVTQCNPEILPQMMSLFNTTALEVCEGQQYDMNFETQHNVAIKEYLEMIRLKTAVLLAASLAAGGIAAAAKQNDTDALYQFGLHVGMAFQLQDDYLDVFANNSKFGKAVGGDIVSNKKTFLMLSALEQADQKTKNELLRWLELSDFNISDKVGAVKDIYKKLKVGEQTRNLSETYFQKAQGYLQAVSVSEDCKQEMRNIIDMILKREH